MEEVKKKFNYRAFYSMGLFLSGLSLPVSGFMNHELQLEELTPVREFWMSIHNSYGSLFYILAIFHLIYNRKALINAMTKEKGAKLSRESIIAAILFLITVILFSLHAFL